MSAQLSTRGSKLRGARLNRIPRLNLKLRANITMFQLNSYASSIGKKLVMAATGLVLIAFTIVHLGLNATIFADNNGVLFDRVAELLRSSWWLHLLELGVFVSLLVHIGQGIWLTVQNRSHRPIAYAVNVTSGFDPARSMGLLGGMILVFLCLHLYQFWLPHTLGWEEDRSLARLMQTTFSQWWMVAIYMAGCGAVAAHLWHGWRSAAITCGWDDKSMRWLRPIGIACALGLPLGLALIPIGLLVGR
jgi:succinate dehydrogenase / fumarate reductase, cytochrome b subunit